MANEKVWRSESGVRDGLLAIWSAMQECVNNGCERDGILPGGMKVKRRAASLYRQLSSRAPPASSRRSCTQLDCGKTSVASKIQGREPVSIHPDDAPARGISDGNVVRLYNDRGACLAGARITDAVRPGVVVLATGTWYDPNTPTGLERHGNPNVLTLDKGTSRLAQGPSAHTTLVEMEHAGGPLPEVGVFEAPTILPG